MRTRQTRRLTHGSQLRRTLNLLRKREQRIEEQIQELMTERVLVQEKQAEILNQMREEGVRQ